MTPTKRKILHAGLVALAGAVTDAGVQWSNGTVDFTKAAAVGLVLGVFARTLGAMLAYAATEDDV